MSVAAVRRSLARGLAGAAVMVLLASSPVARPPTELHVVGRHDPATAPATHP